MKKWISALLMVSMLALLLASCGLSVPAPSITEGEFPFTVTYEYNGETKTVSDVYVCEYDGTSWALDGGAHRSWVGYFKNGLEDDLITIGTTASGENIDLILHMYPEYFMGESIDGLWDPPAPYISVTVRTDEGIHFEQDPEVVEATYGARIVSYHYSLPVANTFG